MATAPTPPSSIIEVRGLAVQRGGQTILQPLDWMVRSREHWVILGANGSGKTSLLSALTGYLMPTQGSVRVLGETFGETDWRDLRRSIGLVSSSLNKMVSPEETARDLVASGLEAVVNAWRISRADRRDANRILDEIGAPHLADRPWQVLSQGERQRLLIGRALMARPRLLILDEPCAGLDPVAREHFLGFVGRLARSATGPSLVLVTHHVEEILPEFSHLLALKEGAVLLQGPIRQSLTSDTLSKAFDCAVHIIRHRGRFRLEIAPPAVGRTF